MGWANDAHERINVDNLSTGRADKSAVGTINRPLRFVHEYHRPLRL